MARETTISLTYGKDVRELRFNSAQLAAPVIRPRAGENAAVPPLEVLRAAMASPNASPCLKHLVAGKRVALVVNDEFRAGLHELILDVMFEELGKGKPSKVTVLSATGTHDPSIYTPHVLRWTTQASEKHGVPFEFVGHDCDDARLVKVGTTSRGNRFRVEPSWLDAEVRVFGHEGKHHYMAGYSTVTKQVLPGIADRASVAFNHKLALDDKSQAGQHPLHADAARRENPFAEDSLEAMRMAMKRSLAADGSVTDRPADGFLLEIISDKDVVHWAQAGDPERVTSAMIDDADGRALFTVPKSRYVVISPGGPPASTSLYSVQNCFDMALLGAIEEGGEALVLGPCDGRPGMQPEFKGLAPDAKSKALFWDNLVRLRDIPLEACYRDISDSFELYLWKTWRVLRLFKREGIKIWMHSELPAALMASGGFESAPDIQAWIDERAKRNDGKFVVIDGGNKLLVRPE